MGLQQFEQRLERLIEGTVAKAFRGQLQPVELGKRLTREMDLHRALTVRGTIAPNMFDINLSAGDFERFSAFIDVLARELVEAAREHARTSRYTFLGPVEVSIGADETLLASTFVIEASVAEGEEQLLEAVVLPDGRRVSLAEGTIVVGRVDECEIQLNDPNVSRRHAEFRRDGDSIFVIDLHSTNGTKVNGMVIRQHRLSDGDVIMIGGTPLRFEAN